MGGDAFRSVKRFSASHFNPRLREGGDYIKFYQTTQPIISIHASAREATGGAGFMAKGTLISIHASAREATTTPPLILRYKTISIQSIPCIDHPSGTSN